MSVERILKSLVGINSVFPNEARLGTYLEKRLKGIGFRTSRMYLGKNRFNIFAERGSGGKELLLYGHTDTVPQYGAWKSDPLKLVRKSGRLYGLGSCDMKGGIASMLHALESVQSARVKLLLCPDEENVSAGAWAAVKRRAWFRGVTYALSGEPGLSKASAEEHNVITVGRRGRVVIDIRVKGVSSHGAYSSMGVNAIDEAAKIVSGVKGFRLRKHAQMGAENVFVNRIESAATSLSLPDTAKLSLDVHLVPPSTSLDAKERAEELIGALRRKGILDKRTEAKASIRKRETPYIEPYANNMSDGHVRHVISLMERNFGSAFINYGSSVADDNILANELHIPVLVIGPKGGNEHSANEWVSARSLAQTSRFYIMLLEEYSRS